MPVPTTSWLSDSQTEAGSSPRLRCSMPTGQNVLGIVSQMGPGHKSHCCSRFTAAISFKGDTSRFLSGVFPVSARVNQQSTVKESSPIKLQMKIHEAESTLLLPFSTQWVCMASSRPAGHQSMKTHSPKFPFLSLGLLPLLKVN